LIEEETLKKRISKNYHSRKHEMMKIQKEIKKIFVFSNFRIFVMLISFYKMQKSRIYESKAFNVKESVT